MENQPATVTINGKQHPIRLPMGGITRVLRTLGVGTAELAEKAQAQDFEELLKFSLTVTWSAIVSGYKFNGGDCPYSTPDQLAEDVEDMDELTPALELWTRAMQKFTGSDEPQPKTSEGESLPLVVVDPVVNAS